MVTADDCRKSVAVEISQLLIDDTHSLLKHIPVGQSELLKHDGAADTLRVLVADAAAGVRVAVALGVEAGDVLRVVVPV